MEAKASTPISNFTNCENCHARTLKKDTWLFQASHMKKLVTMCDKCNKEISGLYVVPPFMNMKY